jgi:hypothetical protein
MRVWDVAAGYLNRQSLLAEHRELHGLRSVIVNGKKGYSRHPETLRWVGCVSGLARRHAALVAEMRLRGYNHLTPVDGEAKRIAWPSAYVTEPIEQYAVLGRKYIGKPPGRIALPRGAQDLWAAHKYSVMARDPEAYRAIGRRVAGLRKGAGVAALAAELAVLMRSEPPRARLVNALEHMWGHVAREASAAERRAAEGGPDALLAATQRLALRIGETYLTASTALSELAVFTGPPPAAR